MELIRILLTIFAGSVFLVVSALTYRAFRQQRDVKGIAVCTLNGIDEELFILIGGMEQWINIRGRDRLSPVLLVLDGGPGAAGSAYIPSPWEKEFVVVRWDQPGAGKTFGRGGRRIDPDLTIEQVVRDGIEIAEYLCEHFGKNKIGLFALSWGTVIGINMIKLRPELFFAYVGTGQVVNMQRGEASNYHRLLTKAKTKGDRGAVARLKNIGPPPYTSSAAFRTQRKLALSYETDAPSGIALLFGVVFAPRYGLGDAVNWLRGFFASQSHFFGSAMNGPIMAVDLPALGIDFNVPVFVFQGTEDDFTPFELAETYVASIQAPEKLFVAVPGAGHFAFESRSEELQKLLNERVKPRSGAPQLGAVVTKS